MSGKMRRVKFVFPVRTIACSLTEDWCALDCAHCGRQYLKHMTPIERVVPDGADSLLISGGCDERGRVPVLEKLELVRKLKREHPGLKLNWHVGLIDEGAAEAIAPLADAVSFDFVGDDATIRQVYGLKASAEDYLAAYRMLRRHIRAVVPHITLGLWGGRFQGEHRAVEALAEEGLGRLVILVFRATLGTRFQACPPPSLEAVGEFLSWARARLLGASLFLGCMRPGGAYRAELDRVALLGGVDGIVQPSPKAVKLAEALGLGIDRRQECCVFA